MRSKIFFLKKKLSCACKQLRGWKQQRVGTSNIHVLMFTFFYLGPKYLGYHWLPQKIVYDFSVISVLRWVIEVMLRPYSTLLRIAAHPCPCVPCLHFFCDILVIPLLFGKLCQESNQVGFDLLVNSTCQRVPAVWKCPKLVAPGCFAQRAIVTGVELKDQKNFANSSCAWTHWKKSASCWLWKGWAGAIQQYSSSVLEFLWFRSYQALLKRKVTMEVESSISTAPRNFHRQCGCAGSTHHLGEDVFYVTICVHYVTIGTTWDCDFMRLWFYDTMTFWYHDWYL